MEEIMHQMLNTRNPFETCNILHVNWGIFVEFQGTPRFGRLKQRPGAAHLTAWKLDNGVRSTQFFQSLADCEWVVYVRTD